MLLPRVDYSADIRALLRCLHKPHEMERNAFALRLKRAVGAPSAYAAFASIVDDAFARAGDAYRVHHQMLQRFDFQDRVPREKAAADLGVSCRGFFYLHAQAIAVIEHHVAALLQRHENGAVTSPLMDMLLDGDPARGAQILRATGAAQTVESQLKQLCADVLASDLQSEHLAFPKGFRGADAAVVHALHSLWLELRGNRSEALAAADVAAQMRFDYFGNPHRLAEIALHSARIAMARHDGNATALSTHAKSNRWSQCSAIEAALANGVISHAVELLHREPGEPGIEPSFRVTAMACLHRIQIQLLSGEFLTALHNAHSLALLTEPHADISNMAHIVHARACIAVGTPLAPPMRPAHGLWYDLYRRALIARSLGDEELASEVFVRAACAGYCGVAAHAAGTLAYLQNDLHRALDAWLLWLRGRHFDQGFDMMPERLGRALLATAPARSLIHDLAQFECAQWPLLTFLEAPPARDVFWGALLDASINGARSDALSPIMNALLARPVAIDRPANGNTSSTRKLANLISILLPYADRVHFVETFIGIANHCNARARRRRDQLRSRIALQLSG